MTSPRHLAVELPSVGARPALPAALAHSHVFLSDSHEINEKRTWLVIVLCMGSMIIEIGCGYSFGSLALVADGLHMGTHVIAFLISALAYSYARRHASDKSFVFGTGKIGDLAAYTSAIILIIVAVLIFGDGVGRFFQPERVNYDEAIPIACIGLAVNVASGLLLSVDCGCLGLEPGARGHSHDHSHGHSHSHSSERYEYVVDQDDVDYLSSDVEADSDATAFMCQPCTPPTRSALHSSSSPRPRSPAGLAVSSCQHDHAHHGHDHSDVEDGHAQLVVTARSDSSGQTSSCSKRKFEEDNNFKAAVVHVVADAVVSLLVIVALIIAANFPKLTMLDPLMGCVGSLVILSWGYQLLRETSSNLLDMCPDEEMVEAMRRVLEGDRSTLVADLHVWRLGPGHLGAIIVVVTSVANRKTDHFLKRLKNFKALSHVTIQVVAPNGV